MLRVKDLGVSYGNKKVFENINFSFKNKIYGIKGKSGCGKTSFVNAILGLVNYEGEIFLDEKPLKNRKNFQIVFQNPFNSFNPNKRISSSFDDIIRLNNSNMNVNEVLKKLDLDLEFLKKYPNELSGGELQRLSIARSICGIPSVIILDEPTSALDVINQKNILDYIKKFSKERELTIIFISHNLKVLKYISDEIIDFEVLKNKN